MTSEASPRLREPHQDEDPARHRPAEGLGMLRGDPNDNDTSPTDEIGLPHHPGTPTPRRATDTAIRVQR